jgi:hypothetical protein
MLKDECIVVDERDAVVGSANKYDCHRFVPATPTGRLHRAFSVFLFDEQGRLLLQQRAASKITFPSVSSGGGGGGGGGGACLCAAVPRRARGPARRAGPGLGGRAGRAAGC